MTAVEQIEERVGTHLGVAEKVMAEVGKVVVGQREMVEGLLWGLLADGHVLLEGVPGLAKTTTVKSLSRALQPYSRPAVFRDCGCRRMVQQRSLPCHHARSVGWRQACRQPVGDEERVV